MPDTAPDPCPEDAVRAWRVRRLLELGIPLEDAEMLADTVRSWHDAARLIDQGCDPLTAARILAS